MKLKVASVILAILICVSMFGNMACSIKGKSDKLIVLLTDFGSADYRVAQLKGIIYSNYPGARLVDASQDIPAFDIPTGAFILDMAAKEFPQDTVFVGIVAPYSQTETRFLVITTEKQQVFILPDNGLITYIARDMGIKTVYQITNQSLFDEPIGQLSAERIQGKVGALIASGYLPRDVGAPLAIPKTLDIQASSQVGNKLAGAVVYVDNYGNCVTNITAMDITRFSPVLGENIQMTYGENTISAKFGNIYSDVPRGKEIVFVNNNLGVLQLSINMGNFSSTYNIKAGTKLEIQK